METINGINTTGWEDVQIPVNIGRLTRIAQQVRSILLSDGIDIDSECESILRTLSSMTRGLIDADMTITEVDEILKDK
ncbi:hypothetical protein SAMN05444362_11461 [Dysgonomonas macrotermitis]|uniref:Uncharacterized protein n=1 Tax=Dysgonomonas macrotermitis TaxID=1346286 RepID=A0A1M5GMQ3_9BACT|nr:hypothetical protein [Dysgonomonas macrotermitis]SHG04782.1 hypothetical protein SAMN05444362_11461 [Dysgonomonas macrotermitis]